MNAMIRPPMLPYIPYNKVSAGVDGVTLIIALLLLAGAVFAAWCIGLYTARHFGGNRKKIVLVFAGITGLVTIAMLCFFGCAAVTIRGIILTLILAFSSYSDIRTRECADHLHLMIVIAAFIGTETTALPGMLLSGIAIGGIMLIPALLGKRSLGGADIKMAAACSFMLGFGRSMIGLTVGLLLAVIINAIQNRKKKQAGFPLIPYLAVGFTAAYFI